MKITDVTVTRYAASRDAQAAGIQIVEVHTDAGTTGTGFVSAVSAGNATSDIVATVIRRNLKAAIAGEDPLLTESLWRRMYDAVPRRGGDGIVRTCIAAVDFTGECSAGEQCDAKAEHVDDSHRGTPGGRWQQVCREQAECVLDAAKAQGFGGGGASTVRSPLCSCGETMPAVSIASIRRAARL